MAGDATIYSGDDVTLEVTVYTDATETTVQDLTGYTVVAYRVGANSCGETRLQVTATANANGSVVSFDSDRTTGIVNVILGDADTALLPVRGHRQQLILANAAGDAKVVLDGVLTVKASLPAVS